MTLRVNFNSLISSGACGGDLIAIALRVRPSGLLPPCGVPFGITTRSPGFTRTSWSPSQIVPVPSRMYCISLALACRCFAYCRPEIATVMPSSETNSLFAHAGGIATDNASPSSSPVWTTCAAMVSAAKAGSRKMRHAEPRQSRQQSTAW